MDGGEFDALARAVARGTTRRHLLKAIGGGAAALLAGVGSRGAAAFICREPGVLCAIAGQCCSGICDQDTHRCACPGETIPCGGVCISPCLPLDQCHVAGVCDPRTRQCTNPVKANGAACDDGNGCTQGDTCQGGVCVAGSPVQCAAPDQCHAAGTCDPATGQCTYPNQTDGTACTGTDACFQTYTCQGGVCTGSDPKTCVPVDQCHQAGSCVNGACTAGPAIQCPAPTQCQASVTCDPANGCVVTDKPDGTSCDDGNACTQTDTCQNGVCAGGNPVQCAVPDQCHDAGTCDPQTGQCSTSTPKFDGAICDGGVCQGGQCVNTCLQQTTYCAAGNTATCCGFESDCRIFALPVCCPTAGGQCLTCPGGQTVCCTANDSGDNICVCCAVGVVCLNGACQN